MPADQPSYLLPLIPSSPSESAQADRGFTTGRKILAYPKGTMPAAVQALSNQSPLKQANIASYNDFALQSLSITQIFQQTDAQGMRCEEVDAIIVKDASVLGSFSPASIGPSGQMPIIGDDHYVYYPVSQGALVGVGGTSPEAIKQLLEGLQQLIQSFQSGGLGQAEAQVAAQAPGQKTWGLDAVKAITSTFTGKNIRVAIIDTGIDPNHPDLGSHIAGTWSFDHGPVNDDAGHGTHVAGTVAGLRSGSLAYGIAPDVQLFIAKVFRANGTGGTDADVIAAINWAIQNRCQVANMSLSLNVPPGTRFDPAFEVIAQNSLKSGLLLVAAAGNNRPAPVGHPANCPSVLAVGALTQDRQIAPFSNAGQQADPSSGQIDFATPGVNVVSSWPTNLAIPPSQQVAGLPNRYALDSGTSMAAPHVTGLAALMSEKLGGIGGLQLWQALALGPIDPLTGLSRSDVGFGLPQAVQS